MRLIYIVIAFMNFGSQSFASGTNYKFTKENCKSLDIRDTNPKLRDHFSSPRDQESMGWCYGFTAADLLSAELGVPVSSTHVVSLYNDKIRTNFRYKLETSNPKEFLGTFKDDEIFNGGKSHFALKTVQDFGRVCTEDKFPFNQSGSKKMKDIITELERLNRIVKKDKADYSKAVCGQISLFVNKHPLFSTSSSELYRSLLLMNVNSVLKQIVSEQCGEDMVKLKDFKVKSLGRLKKKSFYKNIREKLAQGKPVEFFYNVKHVAGWSGNHSSLITGVKWADNKCQIKVRNSWGEGCENYEKEKIESCIKKEGSFWVSSEKFHEMAESITFITN